MRAQKIIRPATAFSVASTKQKCPRIEDAAHLKFIRGLPCCICGSRNVEAAHIRSESPLHGKAPAGGQQKSSDKWTLPLCTGCHADQHKHNELKWWAARRIDPFGLALALFACTGDDEIAEGIIGSHRAVSVSIHDRT
jgi:hypothetical protein